MFGIAFVSNFVSISRKSNILLANFALFLGFKKIKVILFKRCYKIAESTKNLRIFWISKIKSTSKN